MAVVAVFRRTAIPLAFVGMLMALVPALGGRAAPYAAPAHTFASAPGHDIFTWQGVTLQSPDNSGSVASAATPASCSPDTVGDCEDITLNVPQMSPATLYVKISWTHPVWKAYLYVTSPDGTKTYGGPLGCDQTVFDKGCGNETSLPLDEVTIPSPAAGAWKVRVAAVNIHDEAYTGVAALVNSNPLQYVKETLAQLTSHLTRDQPINIVFAGWKPTAAELQLIKENLPDEYIPSTALKQSPDGNDVRDTGNGAPSGLYQHLTSHYTGTDPTNSNAALPSSQFPNWVPYFQPIKFRLRYKFLAADDTYAKDLFAAAQAATQQDYAFGSDRVYATNVTTAPSHELAYLQEYNQKFGQFRGSKAAQCDASSCPVDMVDAFKVEDWIQNSRFNSKYSNSFTDLVTGQKIGAQFINPDPNAVRDPYWNGNGTRPVNVDVNPQGSNQGITFFYMDTFFPAYADQYFRPNRYHTWGSFDHIQDPDVSIPAGIPAAAQSQVDNARGWGGRYRFYFQDMGAAPSFYERENWLREEVSINDGSAAFDPPIWQYRNDPSWNGTAPLSTSITDPNLRAGGSNLGTVLGWDLNQGLAFKYIGSYLYRPIPSDDYILATNNWIDHYSLPSQGGFYKINFLGAYKPSLGLQALNSASPYATFVDSIPSVPHLSTPAELGCATNRQQKTIFAGGLPISTPSTDASCTAQTADPRQIAVEQAKNDGTGTAPSINGTTIPDLGASAGDLRNFIDHNRAKYAPLSLGAFTVPVLNIYFEKVYNVAIPLIVGGLAEGTNDGEGWGQMDNLNERSITKAAIDCSQSLGGGTAAPACAPGAGPIPPGGPFSNARGLTYIVQHEAAHFQGLHHPHDGTASVEKAQGEPPAGSPFTGQWHYYYSMNKWQYDYTASPTTYGHTYGVYEVVDQDRLMYGHVSEYVKQAQDWIADGYFMEAIRGNTSPSPLLQQRLATMKSDRDLSVQLFKAGDYLHSQYAMRNAVQHAKGAFFPAVQPHRMSLTEAALAAADPTNGPLRDAHAIFAINPQKNCSTGACAAGTAIVPTTSEISPLPNTATAGPIDLDPRGMPTVLVGMVITAVAGALMVLQRRRMD